MSSNKRGVEDHFIPPSGNKIVEKGEDGKIKIHTEGPTTQADDTKVQDVNRAVPVGGNQVGRGSNYQHSSVSGGKSLQGNNARSNPPSDKNHN